MAAAEPLLESTWLTAVGEEYPLAVPGVAVVVEAAGDCDEFAGDAVVTACVDGSGYASQLPPDPDRTVRSSSPTAIPR